MDNESKNFVHLLGIRCDLAEERLRVEHERRDSFRGAFLCFIGGLFASMLLASFDDVGVFWQTLGLVLALVNGIGTGLAFVCWVWRSPLPAIFTALSVDLERAAELRTNLSKLRTKDPEAFTSNDALLLTTAMQRTEELLLAARAVGWKV